MCTNAIASPAPSPSAGGASQEAPPGEDAEAAQAPAWAALGPGRAQHVFNNCRTGLLLGNRLRRLPDWCASDYSQLRASAAPEFDFDAYVMKQAKIVEKALSQSVPQQYPDKINEVQNVVPSASNLLRCRS